MAHFRRISIFSQFHNKLRFFRQFKKIDFSGQISDKFRFFRQFHKKFRFSRQKLAIYMYSYFWANYYISLQKSLLSNILP